MMKKAETTEGAIIPTLVHMVNYSLTNETLVILFLLKQKWGGKGGAKKPNLF